MRREYATFEREDSLEMGVTLNGDFVICTAEMEEFYEQLSTLCEKYRI